MANINPNPSLNSHKAETRKYKTNNSEKREKNQQQQYEFCKVCKLNYNQGRRHIYFPNHKKALSSFLSRFQSKLANDVFFFLKNPIPLSPEHASLNRLWCVFCDCDILESGSSFACENAIAHLVSSEHLKEVKGFLWKYGGGIDSVDSFCISEADFAKWEKKCKSLKAEVAVEGSHGSLIRPLNDIHNEMNSDYVNSFNKNDQSFNFAFNFSNGVVPLQNPTNERSQVLHLSGVTENGSHSHDVYTGIATGMNTMTPNILSGSFGNQKFVHSFPRDPLTYSCATNGSVFSHERIAFGKSRLRSISNGESSSQGLQNLTQISSSAREDSGGNVHSGAPPPWFTATERNELDVKLKPRLANLVSSHSAPAKSSKLNPKRVGAAWAERRKIELELEKRGELVSKQFDADWLPNFGRVWQSGSRKESRKEFQVENKVSSKVENQLEKPNQFQPYISKRMRRDQVNETFD